MTTLTKPPVVLMFTHVPRSGAALVGCFASAGTLPVPIAVSILGLIFQLQRSTGQYSCSVPRPCVATRQTLLHVATWLITPVLLSSIDWPPMRIIRLHKRPTPKGTTAEGYVRDS